MYEDEDVIVKSSPIEGLGVFAKRPFKPGEAVLSWRPLTLTTNEVRTISKDEGRYLNTLDDGTKVLMGIPERYVNHAESPNTRPIGKADVALRDIEEGEEITSNYPF